MRESVTLTLGEDIHTISIPPVQEHYNIPENEHLPDYMIYTLDSWKDNKQQARLEVLKNNMSSQLHQPDLSVKGGFLHASVLLVSASTKESIIPLSTLLSSRSAY